VESLGAHESEVTATQGFSLVFTARPHMSFTVWLIGFFFTTLFDLSLPEDPWEKLLAFLAIITVWPLVLGDMFRRMLK
jgi:hypothetical protein